MTLRALVRQAREIAEVPRDLLLGRYPAFVSGGELPRGHVPVFVLHGVTPERFGRQLDHLARNGYRTLTADGLLDVIGGTTPAPERAVALTFDDGRGSVWSVAAPLLRRHGMRGSVFLVPARMRDAPAGPTWDDVTHGRLAAEALLARETETAPFLRWTEVARLAAEGVFTFESHTLSHARIHTSGRLEDFLTPGARRGAAAMDVPWIRTEDGEDLLADAAPLGTPLLSSAPRTSETRRFLEDPAWRRASVAAVAAAGGAGFFEQPDWDARLRRTLGGGLAPGTLESVAQQRESIRSELAGARTRIEARTGRSVRHLCYPWHAAGPTARSLAVEAGYVSAFCGKVRGTPITLPGGDPLAIARVGEDFIELLPGAGRTRLAAVLARKWRRRLARP